ncbi:phosphatidylinositol transporter Ecym_1096 [Eremothecium cymbalariae DBVPG|uniref:SEC14 homolog 3 n=1 Tax=Eremothecium cymbalariae (strain CBS 270.75 / DBVPG 7215 / KCTC 17166 / NRRL Y-17582) TaxID=931890 RepID=G8JME3_ERECY|nr:hypothetical protein Ecym_1096 [Eremothecium cymbalariae DBVPG\
MGLFGKRNDQHVPKPADLIPCEQLIKSPPESYPKADGIPHITMEHHEKYLAVLSYFQNTNLTLPIKSGKKNDDADETQRLSSWEKFWLTRECMLRYLRATNWKVENAIKRLCNTLVWRREFGITGDITLENHLAPEVVEMESVTGKQVLLGYDRERRPIYMMKNGRQNTPASFAQVQHLVFFLEAAVALMPQGVELLALLIDYKHYKEPGIIGASAPPISLAKQVLNIIQDHYPERLGKAYFLNMPWYGWTFLKLVHPFIDPATRAKLAFDESLLKYIDEKQLEVNYGGKLDFSYNHELYWKDFIDEVQHRRESQYGRFMKFGAIVGLSEFDLKGDHFEVLYSPEYNPSE